jgi:nitroimidazol reductase NimA-like FMN-containing flavoprotein (pyridoxamine 5'-phosphate oxidase superfamily)
MYESAADLLRLQQLLDRSHAEAGPHLQSIHTESRRLNADQLADLFRGVCVLNLATVNSRSEPFVAPIDGLFLKGIFWFGSSRRSLRFAHLRHNPAVSAAFTQGEEISVLVHGCAHEVDTSRGEHEDLHDYCREIYGADYDNWGFWGKEPFAWIEPARMFAARMPG